MDRARRIAGPVALVVAALAAILVSLAIGGAASPLAIGDPGPLVRWGLPVARLVVDLSAAGAVGALVLAVFALAPERPEYSKALDVAASAAAVMTVASAAVALLSFLDAAGAQNVLSSEFGDQFVQFLTDVQLGQAWLTTTITAAVVTVACFAVRSQLLIVFVAAAAVFALVPLALQGHAAGTNGHNLAITALGLHLVAAAVWIGGLLTLVLIRGSLAPGRLEIVLKRYSTLAVICFVVTAVSGYLSAELRVGSWANLLTPYGALVLAKVGALVALGLFGAYQRRRLIVRVSAGTTPRSFWSLVVAELAFMGIASGVAAALARTAPPVAAVPSGSSPAELLTGQPLPPPMTAQTLIFGLNLDPLWLLACAFGVFFYLAGVRRLARRGDRWPLGRTVSWIAGMLVLAYVTNGGINLYEQYLFSAHMTIHMVLTMAVPLLLVPGAPVTLAMRAVEKRTDGTRGGREWLLIGVHSWYGRLLANPYVAAVLFAGSLWVFYYTPLFRWATENHIGHEWMIVHFLVTGYLFVQSLIGIDPVPFRLAYPLRLTLLLATMAFHAFFGLAIMSSQGLLLADWFGAMGRTWGATPLADQQLAGGIAWSIGEIPTLVLAIFVAMQWSRSDARETRRRDRAADRDGDAELEAYNSMLGRLADRSEPHR